MILNKFFNKNIKAIRRLFALIFFFIFFGVIGYKLFFKFDSYTEKREISKQLEVVRLTQKEIDLLEEGDIILRRGYGLFSDYISDFLNTPPYDVTHAGIIVKSEIGLEVIHSLASDVSDVDGMQKDSLKKFLTASYPEKIVVVRVKDQNGDNRKKIAEKALYYLEQQFPFDHIGDYEDGSKMYCTEMIWRILEKDLQFVELPKSKEERDKHFFSMKAMYDTVYFDFVINQYSR